MMGWEIQHGRVVLHIIIQGVTHHFVSMDVNDWETHLMGGAEAIGRLKEEGARKSILIAGNGSLPAFPTQ
jgi:hypothetical protein